MRERPILFSAPMVRALLDGTKTQTRRLLYVPTKNSSACEDRRYPPDYGNGEWPNLPPGSSWTLSGWRHAEPGDRLWVRETYMPDPPDDGTWAGVSWRGCKGSRIEDIPGRFRSSTHCLHRASWSGTDLVGWKPSIHMPRWASRITLEVAEVRVERLQDISVADAHDEGTGLWAAETVRNGNKWPNIVRAYQGLWESINGPESWAANPWVWCITFRRIKP